MHHNSRNSIERNNILNEPISRRILEQVEDDTSSLLVLNDADAESLRTHSSDGKYDISHVNTRFSFDIDLMKSNVYRKAARYTMAFAVAAKRTRVSKTSQLQPDIPEGVTCSHEFSITYERVQGVREASQEPHQRISLDEILDTTIDIFSLPSKDYTLGSLPVSRSFKSANSSITSSDIPPNTTNILLLGTSRSGKSTIIKSLMASFHCLDNDLCMSYLDTIFDNIIQPIITLLEQYNFKLTKKLTFEQYRTLKNAAKMELGTRPTPPSIGHTISSILEDPDVRRKLFKLVKDRDHFPLLESYE